MAATGVGKITLEQLLTQTSGMATKSPNECTYATLMLYQSGFLTVVANLKQLIMMTRLLINMMHLYDVELNGMYSCGLLTSLNYPNPFINKYK